MPLDLDKQDIQVRVVIVKRFLPARHNISSPLYFQYGAVSHITYLLICLFARWEHRPSNKERHCFLSVAILSISLLVYPISIVSLSVSLCQVFRGLPLRLFPAGFHVMA